MAFKTYPERQFTENDFSTYVKSNFMHILHESLRYANYFLPDYWTFKHDKTFMGRLWRDSRSPEDPVETYKRLNSLSQAQFNDEMYEHASRLTTWDLPAIKSFGEKYIDSRPQVKMNLTSDNYWLVDTSTCIQNYGYNSIKLNAPAQAMEVRVRFRGEAGEKGFRAIKTEQGGWRFGFVALLKDGTRLYGDAVSANVENGANPDTSLTFGCPANCSKLWLVVSGAPQEHWRHPWDDDASNDEQWPYQVQFSNTNMLGKTKGVVMASALTIPRPRTPRVTQSGTVYLPHTVRWRVMDPTGKQVLTGYGRVIGTAGLAHGGYALSFSGTSVRLMKIPMSRE